MRVQQKVPFNPQNTEHLAQYKQFRASGKWGTSGCPFELQRPFVSIPHMIDNILAGLFLSNFEA